MPKVSVPKSAGDRITVNRAGEEKSYPVSDGEVTVAADDVEHFLTVVDGSKEVAKPAASSKKES